MVNQTTDSLVVECLPSFDGGLKQFFGLEVTDLQSGALTANFTDALPEFQVRHHLCNLWFSSKTQYIVLEQIGNIQDLGVDNEHLPWWEEPICNSMFSFLYWMVVDGRN